MTTPDPAGAGASSSSAPPPPGVARAVTAHPGLLQSNVLRGQFDGFARPGAPASARAAKPKPSDYAPDRRLGLSPALDTPYKRRARRVAGPDFAPLKKEILDRSKGPQDEQIMREWAATEAYARLLDYVQDLAEAVRGVRTPGGTLPKREDGTFRDPVSIVKDDLEEYDLALAEWTGSHPEGSVPQVIYRSEHMRRLLAALDKIDAITDTIPVKEARNRRFGDPAFRDWLSALDELISSGLLTDMLPSTLHPAEIELQGYLMASFGDRQRIDYGTGHELSFLAFLISLSLLGFFSREDDRAVVLLAFDRYLRICRKLQRKYFLEPAGSHGVWGLDDHQFLPYLWGASQLIGGKIQVRSATVPRTSEDWAGSYLYVDALAHIHATKKGPFNEHSPLLYDISGLPDWNRVAQGLLRMWCGEVLGKRVVVQHLGLGKCLPWEVAKFEESDADVASSSAN